MRITIIIVLTIALGWNAIGSANAHSDTYDLDEIISKATELREIAKQSDLSYDLLRSLTTEVGARHPGTPGELAGIKWAERELTKLGFDKVYKEKFSMQGWVRVTESAKIVTPSEQNLVVTALGYSTSTDMNGLTAELALFDSYEELEKAEDDSLDGKIVFINRRMNKARDGSGYGPAVIARGRGASLAATKGASGILIRSIGTSGNRFAHTGNMTYDPDVHKIPAAALSAPDADQIERLLDDGHKVSVSLNIQTQDLGDTESYNVIGEITGRERPEEVVIIGGHLDSWDLGTGALDDGAGVAITMATAKLIKDHLKTPPRRTIRVILWGAEEVGLIGAKAYALRHQDDLSNFVIGSESDFGAGPIYGLQTSVSDQARPVIDAMAQVLGPLNIVRYPGETSGGPDMIPLSQRGVPALRLLQDGTDYFDYHHTPNDTFDKVKPENMKQNVAAWVVFTYMAAEWPGYFR